MSDEARALGAVAFARQRQVFLPAEAGALDRPETRGLLAHELTHVAQQQLIGGLPPEGSEEAGRLEVEAQDAERYHRGDAGAPAPGRADPDAHPSRRGPALPSTTDMYAEQIADELVSRGIARRESDGSLVFGPSQELIDAQVSAAGATGDGAGPARLGHRRRRRDQLVPDRRLRRPDRRVHGRRVGGRLARHRGQGLAPAQAGAGLRSPVAQEERDVVLQRLMEEENERREVSGEQPLSYKTDPDRLRELREQADAESGFHDRAR